MPRFIILFFLLLFPVFKSCAQDHQWWADNVGWDGVSHWSEYIISSPRYLGPNALPIPQQNNGLLPEEHELRVGLNQHRTEGDITSNMAIGLDLLLVSKVVSFDFFWVPLELYQVSHDKKTERRIFHNFYNSESAIGDVQLRTNIQLFEQEREGIDARLRIGYRFANSDHMGAARFTDAPGYFFDMGLGKTYGKGALQWRPSFMGGFYVWQTNRDDQFQNDAVLVGLGLQLYWRRFELNTSGRGYFGYLNNGDKPLVWDFRFTYRTRDHLSIFAGGGLGFKDNLYDRMEIGLGFAFDKKIMPGRTP